MSTFSPVQWARALAALSAVGFILCFLWGLLLKDPVLVEFHRNSLRIFLMDIVTVGSNFPTLIAGTVVSAVWGAIAGAALAFCLNHCGKK